MGKVVILGGNARSGKTTIAFRLLKHGYKIISFDNLNKYIEEGLNINFDSLSQEQQFNLFETVVKQALLETKNENLNICIDMYDYLPSDISKLKNINKLEIYFLAYPSCSKEQIKYNVVHYAKKTDWIAQVNESYLEECVDRFFERNILLQVECKKYNMALVDTKSGDEREKVLNELIKNILNREV